MGMRTRKSPPRSDRKHAPRDSPSGVSDIRLVHFFQVLKNKADIALGKSRG